MAWFDITSGSVKAAWLPFFVGAIFIVFMLLAGIWQLDRAKQKNELRAAYEQALQQPIERVARLDALPKKGKYQRILIAGNFLDEHQFLLDNQVYGDGLNKQVGYDVLTPFVTSEGQSILVNRGWVPLGSKREKLPDVNTREQYYEIRGLLTVPAKGYRLGEMDADLRWPRVIQYIDFDKIAARLQREMYPALMVLDAGQSVAYAYHWKLIVDSPQKHYSYALQWFGMALALAVLLFITLKRKSRRIEQ